MPHKIEYENEVLLAVKDCAYSINSGSKVVANMALLIEATSSLPLTHLDAWERFIRWEFQKELDNSTPAKWKVWVKPTPFLTWIDLCSGDGYRREKTIQTLSGAAPNSFFFALAIRRLNDWVPQVREAAREKLLKIALESDQEQVAEVLCATFPHWSSWKRMEEDDKKILLDIASIESVADSLKSRIITSTAGPMTSILSQVGRIEVLDGFLEEIAMSAIQPSVRAKAYRSLMENRMVWHDGRKWVWTDIRYCKGRQQPIICDRNLSIETNFIDNLKSAVVDKSSVVRRVAGELLIKELELVGEESGELAEKLATDSSPPVSERGKFALKQLKLK